MVLSVDPLVLHLKSTRLTVSSLLLHWDENLKLDFYHVAFLSIGRHQQSFPGEAEGVAQGLCRVLISESI